MAFEEILGSFGYIGRDTRNVTLARVKKRHDYMLFV